MLVSMCLKSPVDTILKVLFQVTSSRAHSIPVLLVCSFFHSQSAAVTPVPRLAGHRVCRAVLRKPLGCTVRLGTCCTWGISYLKKKRPVIASWLRLTEKWIALLATSVKSCVNSVNKSTDTRVQYFPDRAFNRSRISAQLQVIQLFFAAYTEQSYTIKTVHLSKTLLVQIKSFAQFLLVFSKRLCHLFRH